MVNPIPNSDRKKNEKIVEVAIHPTRNSVGKSSSQNIDKWDNPTPNSEGTANSTAGIMDNNNNNRLYL